MKKKMRFITLLLCGMMLASCVQGGVSKVEEYVPGEPVELTINLYAPQSIMDTCAAMFMEKHPEVTVIVNNFYNSRMITNTETGGVTAAVAADDFSIDSYAKYVNTLLMSGDAEDIFLVQELPAYQFEKMGTFLDLAPYIANTPSFNNENYFMNALDAAKNDKGQLFILPVVANAGQIYLFSRKIVENAGLYWEEGRKSATYEEIYDYTKRLYKTTTLPNAFFAYEEDAGSWATFLIDTYINEFIDIDTRMVDFNNETFISLIQGVYDDFRTYQTRSLFEPRDANFINTSWYDGGLQAARAYTSHPEDCYGAMPVSNMDGVVGVSGLRFAVNAKTQNKGLAWEFLQFMLSAEVQSMPGMYWCPLNRAGYDAWVEGYCANSVARGYPVPISVEAIKEVSIGWMEQINGYSWKDTLINNMIYDEIMLFMDDAQTAEETAKNLQHKCDMYLNQ